MVDFVKLAAPFPPSAISWRIGSTTAAKDKGMALAYLDARDVMDRLDAVCGPAGWQCKYTHALQKTVCDIGIMCPPTEEHESHWVWKADGAGDSDIEAEKGALSDAFKRAAVRWGIGRYLYHLPSPWVEIVAKGRTNVIAEHEYKRLEAILAKASAGLPQSKEGPPAPDPDVLEAAKRWVQESTLYLNNCKLELDVKSWHVKYAKALVKLKANSEELYEAIMAVYGAALEATRGR